LDKKLLIARVFQEDGGLAVELPVCLSAGTGVGMRLSLRVKEMTTMQHLS
jgi:hypothetical protein